MRLKRDTPKFKGRYRGEVIDNNDPNKLGRVKVNVFGIFDGIDPSCLPWAIPATSIFSGAGAGFGHFTVPEVNSYVWCFFEEGDMYQPVYFAEALDGVHGLPSERTTNYPSRKVLKAKNGIVIYIDDSANEIKVEHPTGAYLKIDGSGNVTIVGTVVDINP